MEDERITPWFRSLDDGTGIEVVDPIERRRFAFDTESSVRPTPVDEDALDIPVDAAVSFTAEQIRLHEVVNVFVRDPDWELVTEVQPTTEVDLPEGEYYVELNGSIKIYLQVTGTMTVSADLSEVRFTFPGGREIVAGARSYHEHPAATITTSSDPEDMMTAMSYLGSALKTTSCERSYPTLRGHPPAIELGDDLRVPSVLDTPDTGVTIALPPEYEFVFAAAPLAYYLGADVVPSERARIVTDTGFTRPLDGPDTEFEHEVARVLKQVFFLDCLTRIEGHYPVALYERDRIEGLVDLDFQRTYGRPIAEQLETYLEIPFSVLEEYVPRWILTAHVPPTAARIEAIPFVVNDLALVRSPTVRDLSPSDVATSVLEAFLEGDDASEGTRSEPVRSNDESDEPPPIVELERTSSIEDAWFGDGLALNATKSIPQAFRNRIDRSPHDGPIDITVVCNEGSMQSESDVANAIYGSRDELPFSVSLHRNLAVEELRTVFASDTDFLHYIGHTTSDGFHCRDGVLDAATLDRSGVVAFFLNACRSYRQGSHLIEAGSVGGIVTVSDVIDTGAAIVGRTMARLLNLGFPLSTALGLARTVSVVGGQYIVIGDGRVDLVSAESGAPLLCTTEDLGDGQHELTIDMYPPREGGLGTMVFPTVTGNEYHFLVPGTTVPFRLSTRELDQYLSWHPYPVRVGNDLVWNESLDSADYR